MQSYDTLVTGSAGHLGAALMLTLPSLGYTPLGIDILPSATTDLVGSITDRNFIRGIFEGSDIKHIVHAATLHKPHVESHSKQEFVDTNITGTLVLLEEAASALGGERNQIESFVFISTTSAFGGALSAKPGEPAAWIDENVTPKPRNIYGVTKVAAEDLCSLIHKDSGLPVVILRTSRFFNEADDDEERRDAMDDANLKVLELAYRRCDMEDIVSACDLAMKKARKLGFARYIISAPPPFANDRDTLIALNSDPRELFGNVHPGVREVFERKGWKHLKRVDRVYDSSKAARELGWEPKFTFKNVILSIRDGKENAWLSELGRKIGKKGYHQTTTGIYTTR
ncbi:NAD dependent epimerase/dehydratase family protein [Cladochytrium replicatum]|nr:NAD dependent epimerase/dehydratase family protein [Cladochytrium replicatum]